MERLYTSNGSVSDGNLKYPSGKSIFAVNLPLKFFRATVANANTERLKSLHTFFDTYLDYILAKFEVNLTVRNVQKLIFWQKPCSFKTIFDKNLTPFCKTFLWLKFLFDGQLLIFRLPYLLIFRLPYFSVSKIMVIQHA